MGGPGEGPDRTMTDENETTLGAAFRAVAAENRAFPAFLSEHRMLSYADFWAITERFAARMHERGIARGALVALNTNDPVVSLATLLATSLLGARMIVASKVLATTRVVRPSHFLKSPDVQGSKNVPFETIDASWFPGEGRVTFTPEPFHEGPEDLGEPWLYLHTSGTTGQPKFITLSQRVVRDRTAAITGDFPYRQTTMVSLFGYASRPFLARAMGALLNACTIVDTMDRGVWLRAGVNLVVASPDAAGRFLADARLPAKIARIEVSGAKLTDPVRDLLLQSFETVTDIYGASETNKTYRNLHALNADGSRSVKGLRLDSVVEIVDSAGQPCPPGVMGTVRVRNGYLAPGYMNDPEATARHFRDGWFYPGDFALWGDNDTLDVIGREDDVINIGGQKINALLVDMVIASVPGVRGAAAFKNPKPGAADEVLAFVEFDDNADQDRCLAEAEALCQAKLGFVFSPKALRPIDRIPRNDDGAPQRLLCQQVLLQGVQQKWVGKP